MEDLLQYIDLDYYRRARLLIVRAEITQLRQQVLGRPSERAADTGGSSGRAEQNDAAALAPRR